MRILENRNIASLTLIFPDPHRYQFMPRIWKRENPLPSTLTQQWNRIPKVYKGTTAAAIVGISRVDNDSCGCE
jgi:hypothetical protein